jgi:hypothetical protein
VCVVSVHTQTNNWEEEEGDEKKKKEEQYIWMVGVLCVFSLFVDFFFTYVLLYIGYETPFYSLIQMKPWVSTKYVNHGTSPYPLLSFFHESNTCLYIRNVTWWCMYSTRGKKTAMGTATFHDLRTSWIPMASFGWGNKTVSHILYIRVHM